MKKIKAAIILSLLSVGFLLAPLSFVGAAPADEPKTLQQSFFDTLQKGGVITGKKIPGVPETIQKIINVILGLIGVATFILIIYAGGLWLTASGNEEQITKAKGLIKNSVFGLIIVFTAYMFVNFVLVKLGEALSY